MASTLFLRRVLALDAASCAIMGLGLSLGSGALAPLFGIPENLLSAAGLLLLPLACFIGWLSSRRVPPSLPVWLVIAGNLAWSAESFALIAQLGTTPLGTAFVSIQALAVLAITALEYVGLRRVRIAA